MGSPERMIDCRDGIVTNMPTKLILNEELPARIRRALDRDAKTDDITVNDAAVRVLSERFKIEWARSRARFRPVSKRFKLRVSEELHQRVRIEAAMQSMTTRGIVLSILGEHYGIDGINTQRRRRSV